MPFKLPKMLFIYPALFLLSAFSCQSTSSMEYFIRLNQLGYEATDIKTAVVISSGEVDTRDFRIEDAASGTVVFEGTMASVEGEWGDFSFCYTIDFTALQKEGRFIIRSGKNSSYPFRIGPAVYSGITDSLLAFLRVQRCGPTKPYMHEACHLWDCTSVEWDETVAKTDVTGGWHDAGDYTKFHNTTAVTTYLLLLAHEFYPEVYEKDADDSGAPDILEEARIGIDWMLRANYAPGKLINQVQNFQDHSVGWRMPSDDTLRYNRPGYSSIGKNQIGIFTAVMAFASRVWRERFFDDELADRLLDAAKELYAYRNQVPDVDQTQTGMYQDSRWQGKMALGAIELYITTGEQKYLNEALDYGVAAGSDYWWSWGDINALAHYRIARINPEFEKYILQNLQAFEENRSQTVFGDGSGFTWGTTATLMGKALQVILYERLTQNKEFNRVLIDGRDYVLGRNPWGVSFLYGFGENFVKHIHHQVAHFNGKRLPGGIVAGPAPLTVLEQFSIERKNYDYNRFNSDSVLYYDDEQDYVTNEPTIFSNATALFLFAYFEQ